MSLPRRIVPGKRYFITRRCVLRTFLLRPSNWTNNIVKYCLAVAAQKTGMEVHTVVVMSNHWHLVVTDVEGRVSEFLHCAHQLIAKCINASLGRWEAVWSGEAPSVVELADDGAVLSKMAYLIANPVTAGLVRSPKLWPGVITTRLRETLRATRPKVFFREDGPMPAKVTLKCIVPSVYDGLPPAEIGRALATRVAILVREARQSLKEEGRPFLGVKAVLRQAPSKRAHSDEVHRKLNPRVAGETTSARVRAIQRLTAFWRHYRTAWNDWVDGNRTVVFPHGTYTMRLRHGANVGPPPDGHGAGPPRCGPWQSPVRSLGQVGRWLDNIREALAERSCGPWQSGTSLAVPRVQAGWFGPGWFGPGWFSLVAVGLSHFRCIVPEPQSPQLGGKG